MPPAEPTHTISACLLLLRAEHMVRGITTFWQQQSSLKACRACPGVTGWLLIQTGSSCFTPRDCVSLPLDQAVLPVTTIILKIHVLCTRQLLDLGKPRARLSQGNSNLDKLFPASKMSQSLSGHIPFARNLLSFLFQCPPELFWEFQKSTESHLEAGWTLLFPTCPPDFGTKDDTALVITRREAQVPPPEQPPIKTKATRAQGLFLVAKRDVNAEHPHENFT